MAISYSSKRNRDRALFAHWDALPDSHFKQIGIARDSVKAAQTQLQGTIVARGDPTYDDDRLVFNPVFDPYPILIVKCQVESDVAVALAMAALTDKPFAVRSSGHCTAGFSSGSGVLIDVCQLQSIHLDAVNKQVTVGTGVTFDNLNAVLAKSKLHVPGGECGDVCVGGYVQGGGFGFTSTTFGMNCDNVISLRVMLADGSIVIASAETNYDLWWAMRGGTGGNFGVLLQVTYRLQPLDKVLGIALAWPLANAKDIANAVNLLMLLQQNYMLNSQYAPNLNLQISLVYQTWVIPDQPPPPNATPQPYIMLRGLYVGDPNAGEQAVAPLQQIAGCITQWITSDEYAKINYNLLNVPQSQPCFFGQPDDAKPFEDKKSRYVERNLSPDEWRAILNYFITSPTPWSYMYLEFYGGAIANYPADQSAFIHRNVAFNAVLDVFWFANTDRSAAEKFLYGWSQLMAPVWNGRIYQNYPSLNEADYAASYWGYALAGLYATKRKYDPLDAFRFEQAVRAPFSGGGPGPVINLPPALASALAQPIDYSGGVRSSAASAA